MTTLDLSETVYRALPGLSGTQVKTLLESPARYRWERDHPRPRTAAMSLGTLFHALVLGQPLDVVVDDREFRSNADKAWRAEQEALGLTVIKSDVMETARAMHQAVVDHDVAHQLLAAPGESEVSVKGDHRGYPLKGRIDRLGARLIDLKSARDVTPRAMAHALDEYGYALQLAHYAKLVDHEQPPILIACENTAPYLVAVYEIDAVTWDLAQRAVELAWDLYADCTERDDWPSGLPTGIEPIGLKTWAYDQLDERVNPDAYAEMEIG